MVAWFFFVLQTFGMKPYYGNEEQKTIFLVFSCLGLVGRVSKMMHLNIGCNETEFACASLTKFSTKSATPTNHQTLVFNRIF